MNFQVTPFHPWALHCRPADHRLSEFRDWLTVTVQHSPGAAQPRRSLRLDRGIRESMDVTVARWLKRCHDFDALGLEVAR